jgi:hypothetical protein
LLFDVEWAKDGLMYRHSFLESQLKWVK